MKLKPNKNNLLIIHKSLISNNNQYYEFSKDYYSLNVPGKFGKTKVVFCGELYNKNNILEKFNIKPNSEAKIIAELFSKIGNSIAEILEGNFSIVISTTKSLIFFKDYFGLENLYYTTDKEKRVLTLSNKIVLIKSFINLKVNKTFLPQYLLVEQSLDSVTIYERIKRACNYKINTYDYINNTFKFEYIGNSPFYLNETNRMSDDNIISNIENYLKDNISNLTNYYQGSNIVSMMSGGIDSSYISAELFKNSISNSVCASYINTGLDAEYSEDIAKFLNLNHKILSIDGDSFYNGIVRSISASEMPFGFQGESFFYNIFNSYSLNSTSIASNTFLSGQGSDGLFSCGRELRLLKYILKFPQNNISINSMIKLSPSKYKNIIQRLIVDNKENILSKELLSIYLGITDFKKQTVQELLGIDDLSDLILKEQELVNKSPNESIKKLHLLQAYYGEVIRIPNVLNSIAKSENVKIAFPFLNKNLFEFVKNLRTEQLIKGKAKKYHLRKILAKKIPPKFVYRNKISMNIPYLELFNENPSFKNTINEIMESNSDYFNFDNKDLFKIKDYSWLWIKLINFHLWKKQFIDVN